MTARILIVEDNPTNLDLMVYLLRAFGYAPLTAADGRSGMELARQARPDLIICDLELPGLHGYEMGRLLRADPVMRRIPAVAVTALAMVGEREKALAAGFDGYIPKPIDPEIFVSQIEAFLKPGQRSQGAPTPAASTEPERAAHPPRRATILAVDDTAVNLEVIRGTLEPLGYRVLTTTDPKLARTAAESAAVDLILCDIHMPLLGGLDFLRCIRANPIMAGVPVMLMSSSGLLPEDLAAAGVPLITRPVDPQVLIRAVEACLAAKSEAAAGGGA